MILSAVRQKTLVQAERREGLIRAPVVWLVHLGGGESGFRGSGKILSPCEGDGGPLALAASLNHRTRKPWALATRRIGPTMYSAFLGSGP